jgi:hypothetical protein
MRIMLRLLDNRVGAGNTAVKKSTGEIFFPRRTPSPA